VNEADFRCADMRGWTPQKQPIITHAQPCLYTPIDTHKLVRPISGGCAHVRLGEWLRAVCAVLWCGGVCQVCELSQEGWPVTTSDDAGRYVCNWVRPPLANPVGRPRAVRVIIVCVYVYCVCVVCYV
jgi:hypothetical protein